jgi:hypothetical protein
MQQPFVLGEAANQAHNVGHIGWRRLAKEEVAVRGHCRCQFIITIAVTSTPLLHRHRCRIKTTS